MNTVIQHTRSHTAFHSTTAREQTFIQLVATPKTMPAENNQHQQHQFYHITAEGNPVVYDRARSSCQLPTFQTLSNDYGRYNHEREPSFFGWLSRNIRIILMSYLHKYRQTWMSTIVISSPGETFRGVSKVSIPWNHRPLTQQPWKSIRPAVTTRTT